MIAVLAGSRVEVDDAPGWAVTSLSPADPGFMPTRYWRGPIWPILNWALESGLDRYGYSDLAAEVRRASIDLSSGGGFWEHYSPLTRQRPGRRAVRLDCRARPRPPTDGGPTGPPERGH